MGEQEGPKVVAKKSNEVVKPDRCLPVPHDELLHFSRCLQFDEREKYVGTASEDLRGQVGHLLSRVEHIRAEIDSRPDGEFWTSRLADHMADFRSKPQPKKVDRSLAATLSRLHIGSSRTSRIDVPGVPSGVKALSAPNIASVLSNDYQSANHNTKGQPYRYKGLQAGAVYFKNGEPYTNPKLEGTFPYQTTPLSDLLAKDGNRSVLKDSCDEGTIRWFHIPSNNMEWVEEAIARHYNEERPGRDELFDRPKNSSKTQEVLRRVGWRGHSREGIDPNTPPHTRSMTPGCDVVKTGRGNPNVMCLFVSLCLIVYHTQESRANLFHRPPICTGRQPKVGSFRPNPSSKQQGWQSSRMLQLQASVTELTISFTTS